MIIYPAIDLLDGRCVRLHQGEYDQVTLFDADPLDAALRWRDHGAEWLHIIDLSGARQGHPVHLGVVARIVQATGLPVRLGGGLRTQEDIAAAIDAGVMRTTVGTAALQVDLLTALVAQWGAAIEVALDLRGDAVAVEGWRTAAPLTASHWARQAALAGVRSLLVTDIARDGTLTGANTGLVARIRNATEDASIAITIAGGVTSIADITALAQAGADGAVIGRALYTGQLSLPDALAAAKGAISC